MGRLVELYGSPGSGKTTMALTIIAETQKLNKNAVFIDAEHALDIGYAQALGVNTSDLLVSQPKTGEEAFCIIDLLASTGAIDVIVIDSLAALVPKVELEGEMGDDHSAVLARLTSQALKKISVSAEKHNCLIIFINQIRFNLTPQKAFEVTPGGNAIKHYASIRLDVRRMEAIRSADKMSIIGCLSRVKIMKNRFVTANHQSSVKGRIQKGLYAAPAQYSVKTFGREPVRFTDFRINFGVGIQEN